jgi:pyridoxine 4-dehydrogenase
MPCFYLNYGSQHLKITGYSAQSIAKKLGTKKLDLFEPARVGLDHSVEEVVRSLKTLQDEGLFDYIGLSEVGAQSLRNASKIAKITAVEIEVSPWSYDQDIKDGN